MSYCTGAWPPTIRSFACFSDVLTLRNTGTASVELAPGINVAAGSPIDWTGFGAEWEILDSSTSAVLRTFTAVPPAPPGEPSASGLWLPAPLTGGQLQFFLSAADVVSLGTGSFIWRCWAISPAGNPYALFQVTSIIE